MLFDRDLPYKSTSLRGEKAVSGKLFPAFFLVPPIEVLLYLQCNSLHMEPWHQSKMHLLAHGDGKSQYACLLRSTKYCEYEQESEVLLFGVQA